jgi:hypothetical protein
MIIPNRWKVIKFHGSKPPARWASFKSTKSCCFNPCKLHIRQQDSQAGCGWDFCGKSTAVCAQCQALNHPQVITMFMGGLPSPVMMVVSSTPAFLRAFARARGVEVDLGTELGPTYIHIGYMYHTYNWLVVSPLLKNIRQLGWLSPIYIYGKIKNVHHEPGIVYKLNKNHTPI